MVYHGAEHSRFSHSLGVYEIARRMGEEVADIKDALSPRERVVLQLAGLLHDIGHGPYSHSFEEVSGISHESLTCRIIEENTSITKILENASHGLSKEVADVIRHQSRNPLLPALISSQLDADRMDYLLRDTYFTGTSYGLFDLERILRTLRVHDGQKVVVKQSGMYAVENYIMARYHMYWQVYYHPVCRCHAVMLKSLFQRMRDISYAPGPLAALLLDEMDLSSFFNMDDAMVGWALTILADCDDPILRDLALRIRDRHLFEACDSGVDDERIRWKLVEHGFDLRYYWASSLIVQNPYVPYLGDGEGIYVRMKDGSVKELSEASPLVHSLSDGKSHDDNKVFYPLLEDLS